MGSHLVSSTAAVATVIKLFLDAAPAGRFYVCVVCRRVHAQLDAPLFKKIAPNNNRPKGSSLAFNYGLASLVHV